MRSHEPKRTGSTASTLVVRAYHNDHHEPSALIGNEFDGSTEELPPFSPLCDDKVNKYPIRPNRSSPASTSGLVIASPTRLERPRVPDFAQNLYNAPPQSNEFQRHKLPQIGIAQMKLDTPSPDHTTQSSFKPSWSPMSGNFSTGQTSFLSGLPPYLSGDSLALQQRQIQIEVPATTSEFLEDISQDDSSLALTSAVALSEQVACTKVYFETHYHGVEFDVVTPRSLRRRRIEFETGFRLDKAEKDYIRQCFFREESNYLREMRNMKARRAREARGISAAGFEVIRALGKGSFGTVVLVQEKQESQSFERLKPSARNVYAMKVIHKSDMLRNAQEGHLRAERDFLVRSASENCNWIVPLISCFQDVDNLYLVMEFEIGGDFLEYLLKTKYGVVDEATTR